jgi:hypothetical protein
MTEQESRALTVAPAGTAAMTVLDQAKILAASGFFPDIKSISQAAAKIMAGQELGVGPMASLRGVYIIDGAPRYAANLLGAVVKRSRRYDYLIITLDDTVCELAFTESGREIGRSRFTAEDAKKAGLVDRANWKKYPRNMLFARAMTNGVNWYCPDVAGGMEVIAYAEENGRPLEMDTVVDGHAYELPSESLPKVPEGAAYTPKATKGQLASIHIIAKEIGWIDGADKVRYYYELGRLFGVEHATELAQSQAAALIEYMASERDRQRGEAEEPRFFGARGPGGGVIARTTGEITQPPARLEPPAVAEWEEYKGLVESAQRIGLDIVRYADFAREDVSGARLATLREELQREIDERQPALPMGQ